MAKTYVIQRQTSKATKYLATGPKAKTSQLEWVLDPMDAYSFEDLEKAEDYADDDRVGGTVVRLKVANQNFQDMQDTAVKKHTTPALEDLKPIARAKSTKRAPVKVKEEDEGDAPKTRASKAPAKAAPAPAKKAAKKAPVPAKKAATKERTGRRGSDGEETKLTAMRLPLSLVDKLKEHGGGNTSEGVRAICEAFFARRK